MTSQTLQQMEFIKNLDFYPKFTDDFSKKTKTGGILAILSFILMTILFYFRFISWLNPPIETHFFVPKTKLPFRYGRVIDPDRLPKMDINFDIFLYHLPCSYIHVDVFDTIQESDESTEGKIKMERYDQNQNRIHQKHFPKDQESFPEEYCGSCYGMKEGCCNTCKDVRKAFKAKKKPLPPIATIEQCAREDYVEQLKNMANESCRVYGKVSVHEHPGTLHIAPGDSLEETNDDVYEKLGVNISMLNISHKVIHFSVGNTSSSYVHYPLDEVVQIQNQVGREKFYYFIRIVPVGLEHDQYSISASRYQNYRKPSSKKYPGIFFHYSISPISVYKTSERSIIEFLVEMSAIIGGTFALFSFIDAILFKISDDDHIFTKNEQYQILKNNM